MHTLTKWIHVATVVAALAGCETVDGDLAGPNEGSSLSGKVAEPTETYASAAAPSGGSAPAAAPMAQGSATASVVEAARVNSDGSLTAVASAAVAADGSYRLEGVPTGRSDLMVVARSSTGGEVGRVLVAGTTQGQAMVAAPITARSTVHALAYSELRAMGAAANEVSPAELELMLQAQGSAAAGLARSRTEVRALAAAYVQARDAADATYARLGHSLDVGARQRILASAQAEHHVRLDGGLDAESSYDAYLNAAVDALVGAGAAADAVVLASAASGQGATRVGAAGATQGTRLIIARGNARMNLAARVRLLAGQPSSAARERQVVAEALASGRLSVQMASSAEGVEEALVRMESRAREGLFTEVTVSLAGVGAEVRARAEAAWGQAFEAADLTAELRGETSASGWANAALRYRQRVQAAARAFVESAGGGMSVQANAMADLLVAARGG
jgi:hypothetical protein